MSVELIDPTEPPEATERMRAADLKNRPVLLYPQRYATEEGRDGKPWTFVECDVWTLDRQGIVDSGTEVRVSWWRAIEQLRNAIGSYVGCKPTEQEDRSIILTPLKGDAREVAAKVAAELGPRAAPTPAPEFTDDPFADEPF